MLRAGRRRRNALTFPTIGEGEAHAVAFVLHSAEPLAQTEALATFLRGVSQISPKPIRPIVYVLHGSNARLEQWCRAAHSPVVWIDPLVSYDFSVDDFGEELVIGYEPGQVR
jgi:hypothetical protein